MLDKYDQHKLIYDIIDTAIILRSETIKLSTLIDPNNQIPNSLQSMLGKIYRYEGSTQADIAKIYHLDYKNTIKYASELEKRGYVKKVSQDNVKRLYLTDKGKMINEHFMKTRGVFLDRTLEIIDKESLEKTRSTLDELVKTLKDYNKQLDSN